LLDRVRDAIARRHYSRRTEETYVHWIKRFIHFHGTRHPRELGETEVTAFLNHLARDRDVAASTQNQALSALLFLYKEGAQSAAGVARRPGARQASGAAADGAFGGRGTAPALAN
jgi:hypothetical protein